MAAFTVAHLCMFHHFSLFINYGYLELMISRVHISAYEDWWPCPRCWSHAEGPSLHRICAVTLNVFLQWTCRHSWQKKCSWWRKFQKRLSFPLHHCMRKTFLHWCASMCFSWGTACCPVLSFNPFPFSLPQRRVWCQIITLS